MGLKKSLKIQKGYSEFVNRKRTENTMVIRKGTKGKTKRSTKHTYKTKDRALNLWHDPIRDVVSVMVKTDPTSISF
jgi:hypothetical protein